MYPYNPYNQQQAMAYSQDLYNSRQYPQPQQPRPQYPQVIAVPDELTARSAQIPMDGTDTFFHNAQAGEIYTKRLSMVDGSICFDVYKKRAPEYPEKERYATVAQLDEISARLKKLEGGDEQ